MIVTLKEEPWGMNVRRRIRWKSLKTKRVVWWEFTNQDGDKDWHYGEPIYTVKTAPRGTIDIDTPRPYRDDRHMFTVDIVERFEFDLVDMSVASQQAYARRKG